MRETGDFTGAGHGIFRVRMQDGAAHLSDARPYNIFGAIEPG
jgi:hypothetical protein